MFPAVVILSNSVTLKFPATSILPNEPVEPNEPLIFRLGISNNYAPDATTFKLSSTLS